MINIRVWFVSAPLRVQETREREKENCVWRGGGREEGRGEESQGVIMEPIACGEGEREVTERVERTRGRTGEKGGDGEERRGEMGRRERGRECGGQEGSVI